MPETTPRLASADPGTQPGYAPYSWTAILSLAVAGLFLVILVGLGAWSYVRRQPLIEAWLLFLPALAVVLAFVARRQIRASEGTRVGEGYANLGWWLAVLGGLGYIAYLGAIEFAVRRGAEQEFVTWSNYLKDADPKDPKDPNLYSAFWMVLPPGERVAFSPKDAAGMDRARGLEVQAFRGSDVVRICARNHGAVEFRPQGLRDWAQKPNEIGCTLSATLATPEGDFSLVVPMRAVIDDKKQRSWQIMLVPDGYVKGRSLTRYGWMVEHLEVTARLLVQEMMSMLAQPHATRLAYLAYVEPGWDRDRAVAVATEVLTVGGGLTAAPPLPGAWHDRLTRQVFARPGGEPVPPSDVARFLYLWNTPAHIAPVGALVRGNPDKNVTVVVKGDAVEVGVPVELLLSGEGPASVTSRGRVVLHIPPGSDPSFVADLAAAREAGASGPRSDAPPPDVASHRVPWRVLRIESDLKPAPSQQPTGGPGMPPMPGRQGGGMP